MRKGRRELRPFCNQHGPIRFALQHRGRAKSVKERKEERRRQEETRRRQEARLRLRKEREEAASIGLALERSEMEEAQEEKEERMQAVKEEKTAAASAAADEAEDDEDQPGAPRSLPAPAAARELRRSARETATPTTEAQRRLEEARQRELRRQQARRQQAARQPSGAVSSSSSSPLHSPSLPAERPPPLVPPPAATEPEQTRKATRDALTKVIGMDRAREVEQAVYARSRSQPQPPLSSSSASSSRPVPHYNNKMRSLTANLNMDHNKPWRLALQEGRLTAEQLVSMDEEEFASAEVREERRRNREEAAAASIRPDRPETVRSRDGAIVSLTAVTLQRVDSQMAETTAATVAMEATEEASEVNAKVERG